MAPVAPDATTRRSNKPRSQWAADVILAIALITIATVYYESRRSDENKMPAKVVDSAETSLYLTAGGIYTIADIIANGNQTASERFKGFQAKHDFDPQVGDALCPVTRTKANSGCSWIIGGYEYFFCCPPCIDEFLIAAKLNPSDVEMPSFYVQGAK